MFMISDLTSDPLKHANNPMPRFERMHVILGEILVIRRDMYSAGDLSQASWQQQNEFAA